MANVCRPLQNGLPALRFAVIRGFWSFAFGIWALNPHTAVGPIQAIAVGKISRSRDVVLTNIEKDFTLFSSENSRFLKVRCPFNGIKRQGFTLHRNNFRIKFHRLTYFYNRSGERRVNHQGGPCILIRIASG